MRIKSAIIACLMFCIGIFSLLLWWPVTSEVKLIGSSFYRDGGSRDVSYEKNGMRVTCVIDGRIRVGTGKIFIGGFPEKEGTREIRFLEIFGVYRDVGKIISSEDYKKFTKNKIDHKEIIDNPLLAKEWRTQQDYRHLKTFRRALLLRTAFMPAVRVFYSYMNERDRSAGR